MKAYDALSFRGIFACLKTFRYCVHVSYSCEGMKQMICWSMALLHLLQTETEQLRIRCSFSSEFVYIPSILF